jgi:hypothetical protein
VLISSNPAGGAGDWTATPIDIPNKFGGTESVAGVSCPTASLCVLTASGSDVVTSTEPDGGEHAWHLSRLEVGTSAFSGVSCASRRLCAAVDDAGNVVTSTHPLGGPGAWSPAHVDARGLTGVACPSARLCVAVDEAGDVLTATDPAGGADAWSLVDVDGATPLKGISCASLKLCVAIDEHGDVVTSTEPTHGPSAWHVASIGGGALEGVSCPSASLCVVTDRGDAITSTHPASGASAWKAAAVGLLPSISCPATKLCVTTGEAAYGVVISTHPTGGGAWTYDELTSFAVPQFNGLWQVSCAKRGVCVASTLAANGSPGNVLVSSDPTGGAEAWAEENVYGIPLEAPNPMLELYAIDLTGVSCITRGICAVVDSDGRVMVGSVPA